MPSPRSEEPRWAEALVRLLDDGFTVPGTKLRFGFDGLIGLLIPVAGDVVGVLSSLSLFWLALRRNVPRTVLLRMAANVALDTLVGAVPVLGDLFDFGWKANRRNLNLIRAASERAPTQRRTLGDYLVLASIALLISCALATPIVLAILLVRALSR